MSTKIRKMMPVNENMENKNIKKIKKILVIICTYNPDDRNYDESFEDFSYIWFDVIRSWQIQRSNDLQVDIVVADNVSGPKTRAKLIEFQHINKDFYICFVDERFTSPFISFNQALSHFKNKEHYDYYAYCAADAQFNKTGDLKILLEDMDENCCMISPQADYDMIQRFDFDENKPPSRLRLNEAVNNHLAVWTKEFFQAYDFKYFDIIGGGGTEQIFTYACSAIKRHVLLSHKVCIHHLGGTDRLDPQPLIIEQYKRDFYDMLDEGVKIGFGFHEVSEDLSVYVNQFLNNPRLGPYYLIKYVIIKYIVLTNTFRNVFGKLDNSKIIPEKIVNFVEELQGKPYVHRHNPDCFDENGYAKTDDLYHFIKDNLFLTKDELDYEKINHEIYYPK